MTKYKWHNPEAAVHQSRLMGSSRALYDDVREFMESLEKEGLLAELARKAGLNCPAALKPCGSLRSLRRNSGA